jgi:multidrug efflux pump subunit AcrA (membrane-fusion protein)
MGKVVSISADSFPPDNSNPQERFKATVELDTDVMVKDGEQLRLQPGMAITGLIKLGKQPVISIITDRFNAFFDSASKIR